MQPFDIDKSWCIEAASSIAENILARARFHEGMLYWDPGFNAKGGQEKAALECSFGFGTPGILLFLARLNSIVPDSRYNESIGAAIGRILKLLKSAPIEGMYIGALGALSALLETQRIIGKNLIDHFLVQELLERVSKGDDSESCSVSNGYAGSILALELIAQNTSASFTEGLIQRNIEKILSAARLENDGLVCGRHFDAIRMPVGFYSGTAGIRYGLAPYQSTAIDWVREGLSKYERSAYEQTQGAWKDFVNESFFEDPSNAVKINRALLRSDTRFFKRHAHAFGWGAGSAGIIATQPSEIKSEIISGLFGFTRSKGALHTPMEVFGGVAGICSSALQCYSRTKDPDILSVFQEGLRVAREQFNKMGRFRTCDWRYSSPLGLLSGESGIGMFLLDLYVNPQQSFLFPSRPSSPVQGTFTHTEVHAKVRRRHFPLTEQLKRYDGDHVGFSASDFIHSSAMDEDPLAKNVFQYELTKLRADLDGPPIIMRSCRQAYIEDFKTNLLNDASDDEMRQWKVRLALGCNLGLLNFGWTRDSGPLPNALEHTLILLYPDVDGVQEIVLSAHEYQLLNTINRPIRIGELVHHASAQWPFNESSKADAECQIFSHLRKALSVGYIEFI